MLHKILCMYLSLIRVHKHCKEYVRSYIYQCSFCLLVCIHLDTTHIDPCILFQFLELLVVEVVVVEQGIYHSLLVSFCILLWYYLLCNHLQENPCKS